MQFLTKVLFTFSYNFLKFYFQKTVQKMRISNFFREMLICQQSCWNCKSGGFHDVNHVCAQMTTIKSMFQIYHYIWAKTICRKSINDVHFSAQNLFFGKSCKLVKISARAIIELLFITIGRSWWWQGEIGVDGEKLMAEESVLVWRNCRWWRF